MAVAGGNTPKPLYQALADVDGIDWHKWHIFFGDERFVPPTDPHSNFRMVTEAWLSHGKIPASNIHPMPTEGDPATCASAYDRHLRQFWQLGETEMPQLDLILLGMGDDGHTASLFPFTPALTVVDRAVTVGEKDGQPRLTLTVPAINNAKAIIFLVEGATKAQALKQVFSASANAHEFPARLIDPKALWLVDRACASLLD
jgi:6-phosphogluconolactonase